jgi:hypothetical protein
MRRREFITLFGGSALGLFPLKGRQEGRLHFERKMLPA